MKTCEGCQQPSSECPKHCTDYLKRWNNTKMEELRKATSDQATAASRARVRHEVNIHGGKYHER